MNREATRQIVFPSFALLFLNTVFISVCSAQTTEIDIPTYEISINDGRLEGDGADLLQAELRNAQFILIGEQHGFADPSILSMAIAKEARPFGLKYHAVEVGPHSTKWASGMIRTGGADGLATALADRALAVPFLSMREDAELAEYFLSASDHPEDSVWGIDQEFVGSPLIHLEALSQEATDKPTQDHLGELLAQEKQAFQSGNQAKLFMFSSAPDVFEELARQFSDQPECQTLIESLRTSANIYQLFPRANYQSNALRVQLIQKYFFAQYRSAKEANPRVLLKMGLNHVLLGTTDLNTNDIGNALEGAAAANGLGTLRIGFVPLAGRQTKIQPSPDGIYSEVDYQSKPMSELLTVMGIEESQIATEGWTLIPLKELRFKLGQAGLNSLPRRARTVVLGLDYLVTTRGAKPATPLVQQ